MLAIDHVIDRDERRWEAGGEQPYMGKGSGPDPTAWGTPATLITDLEVGALFADEPGQTAWGIRVVLDDKTSRFLPGDTIAVIGFVGQAVEQPPPPLRPLPAAEEHVPPGIADHAFQGNDTKCRLCGAGPNSTIHRDLSR